MQTIDVNALEYHLERNRGRKPVRIVIYVICLIAIVLSVVVGILYDRLELKSLEFSSDIYTGTVSELKDIQVSMKFTSWLGLEYNTKYDVYFLLGAQLDAIEDDKLVSLKDGSAIDTIDKLDEYISYSLSTGTTTFSVADDFICVILGVIVGVSVFIHTKTYPKKWVKHYNKLVNKGKKVPAIIITYKVYPYNGRFVVNLTLSVPGKGITTRKKECDVLLDEIPADLKGGSQIDLYCNSLGRFIPDISSLKALV